MNFDKQFKIGTLYFRRNGIDTLQIGGKKVTTIKYVVIGKNGNNEIHKVFWFSKDGSMFFTSDNKFQPKNGVAKLKRKPKSTKEFFTKMYTKQKISEKVKNVIKKKLKLKENRVIVVRDEKSEDTMDKIKNKLESFLSWVGLFIPLFTLFLILSYYKVTLEKIIVEKVSNNAEEKLNKYLFSGHKKGDNKFKPYSELINSVNMVLNKKKNGVIIGGPPGTGKSFVVRRELFLNKKKFGKDYYILKGSAVNLSAVYSYMYQYRDKLLILDDFDVLLKDQDTVNLLKSATDTYPVRIISLISQKIASTGSAKSSRAPDKFEFKGRIIVITNLPGEKIDTALKSRMGYININFNVKDMQKIIETMFRYINPDLPDHIKKEVLDFLVHAKTTKYKNLDVSLRTFKTALDIRVAYPNNWKQNIVRMVS